MMFNEPNPEKKPELEPITPEELQKILSQGAHTVNVVGPGNQLAANAIVIAGMAHALPLRWMVNVKGAAFTPAHAEQWAENTRRMFRTNRLDN